MNVIPSNFTIAEYCQQMEQQEVKVNRNYQRSPKVWPDSARSYLIETILMGYPIPKISLYQKTDVKSRKTIKEIVDGQQRSQAIYDFYQGNLKIVGNKSSEYYGMRYSDLEESLAGKFLGYHIGADVFVNTEEFEIRQVFRRMNSYTVPLNPQETRHATNQGEFKFFVVSLLEKYSESLKNLGVFNEKQLSRMADAELLAEIIMTMTDGIKTGRRATIDKYYTAHENFPESDKISTLLDIGFSQIFQWQDLHNTPLMRPNQFLPLFLAIVHFKESLPILAQYYSFSHNTVLPGNLTSRLTEVASILEDSESHLKNLQYEHYHKFLLASKSSTNTDKNRQSRFEFYCQIFNQ
jgi:hypothetical protein